MQTWTSEEFDESVNTPELVVYIWMPCGGAGDSLQEHNKRGEYSLFIIKIYSVFNMSINKASLVKLALTTWLMDHLQT